MIKLELKAKHFEGTEYISTDGCAIEKAAEEYFKNEKVNESVNKLHVGKDSYRHDSYGFVDFLDDQDTARSHNFDETVIRTITLKPV